MSHSDFFIPGRLSFQPYSAKWRLVTAEIVDWAERPKEGPVEADESSWVQVFLGKWAPTVLIKRVNIPPGVIFPSEDARHAPSVDGRSFKVLVCENPGWMKPLTGESRTERDAWTMRDEFIDLDVDADWDLNLLHFLNKWGGWDYLSDFGNDPWNEDPSNERKMPNPDFALLVPHLLKKQREKFREGILSKNEHAWLRSHMPPQFERRNFQPFYVAPTSLCKHAIEATISIDHLSKRRYAFCERESCRGIFEINTSHKKRFCSDRCINAANQADFRKKKREAKKANSRRSKSA